MYSVASFDCAITSGNERWGQIYASKYTTEIGTASNAYPTQFDHFRPMLTEKEIICTSLFLWYEH